LDLGASVRKKMDMWAMASMIRLEFVSSAVCIHVELGE
jgi:hypothetical protein